MMIKKWLNGLGSPKRNLIRYNKKEKDILFDSLETDRRISIHVKFRKGFVDHFLSRHEIIVLLNHPDTDWGGGSMGIIYKLMVNETKKFLFEVPLNKVPLYFNSFPELARWRLKIGK